MAKKSKAQKLLEENQELRTSLEELEETLRAIRSGEVDALVVYGDQGEQVYTLTGANQSYRVLVETMNEGTATVTPDGAVLYSNSRLAAMLKMSLEKVIGTSMRLHVAEADRSVFDDLLTKGMQTACQGELSLKSGEGTVPVQFSLSPVRSEVLECALIVITDLTEQKKVEDALRRASETLETQVRERTAQLQESEERYRAMIELSPDAIAIQSEGRYVFVNPAAVRLFGAKDPIEIIGKQVLELVHPDYWEVLRQKMKHVEEKKASTPPIEVKNLRIDGSDVYVEAAAAPITYMGKPATQVIIRDITERKRIEEELRKVSEELERSNSDLQQFARFASHDLQAPLKTTEGFTKLFMRRYKGKIDKHADEILKHIVEGLREMQTLVKDLMEFSRIGSSQSGMRLLDTSQSLAQALSNLRAEVAENNAEVTHDDPLPEVKGEPSEITRLFQNLVGNAIRFHGNTRPMVHISAKRQGDEWVFSVKDNGIGIDPGHHARIFEMFKRLHGNSEYTGTGIGLAACKRIVEWHGGRIWVESVSGKGSVFFFTIPVYRGED